ncbi:hypothetical protein GGR58DRAFT_483047 [Xylaria digitata]|nr:hypothetical protein GGR58DRAFT_483047 [Xylaria digitata]
MSRASTIGYSYPRFQGFLFPRPPDPYQPLLPDTCSIYFNHGDLNLESIIIPNPLDPRRVIGIVDWEQVGWYPEYWGL